MKPGVLCLRLLLIITDVDSEKKVRRLFDEEKLPVYHQFRARGTARTELLDICGLSGSTRLMTASILPKALVPHMFEKLEDELSIWRRGNGIAATIPVTGVQESMGRLLKEEVYEKICENVERDEQEMKKEASYAMVLVTVKEGYSDDVIDAATKAGARGGSVIRGRRRGNEALVKFLGISMQEEQEIVMIIVPKEKKTEIMTAVNQSCGIRSKAKGILVSVPVEDMIGMGSK